MVPLMLEVDHSLVPSIAEQIEIIQANLRGGKHTEEELSRSLSHRHSAIRAVIIHRTSYSPNVLDETIAAKEFA
jgi:hypothetical protein